MTINAADLFFLGWLLLGFGGLYVEYRSGFDPKHSIRHYIRIGGWARIEAFIVLTSEIALLCASIYFAVRLGLL